MGPVPADHGKVMKNFTSQVHVVNFLDFFPEGIPGSYKFFRGIDYHSKNPWACVWLALSPFNELFVWNELKPDPDKMVTYDIARTIVEASDDYHYVVNKIDPYANEKRTTPVFPRWTISTGPLPS